jgi:hypothetical protein
MESADAANWLIALCIDHARGDDVAETVRRVRALPLDVEKSEIPKDAAAETDFASARTAGDAVDGLINDLRSQRLGKPATWKQYALQVEFLDRGKSVVVMLKTVAIADTIVFFGQPTQAEGNAICALTHAAKLAGFMLMYLALALGPLPNARAPP